MEIFPEKNVIQKCCAAKIFLRPPPKFCARSPPLPSPSNHQDNQKNEFKMVQWDLQCLGLTLFVFFLVIKIIVERIFMTSGCSVRRTKVKGLHRNRNRKLLISRAPTKAKSQEPAYSQWLNQNKIDRQRSRSKESGRQTVRRLWWMVFGVETGREAWG